MRSDRSYRQRNGNHRHAKHHRHPKYVEYSPILGSYPHPLPAVQSHPREPLPHPKLYRKFPPLEFNPHLNSPLEFNSQFEQISKQQHPQEQRRDGKKNRVAHQNYNKRQRRRRRGRNKKAPTFGKKAQKENTGPFDPPPREWKK